MRRPPIACQRAVQSLQPPPAQHIWVPDEVLSLAVHRFFRSTCPQQKRHGSNVPGPLEARKRAAKRRMTASAGYYPQDSLPISFSFGALFKYRSNPQTSWRYEPPSLPKTIPGLDSLSSAWEVSPSADVPSQDSATETHSTNYDLFQPLAQQPTQLIDESGCVDAFNAPSSDLASIERTLLSHNELQQSTDNFKAGFAVALRDRSILKVEGRLKGLFEKHLPSTPYVSQYSTAVLQHLNLAGSTPVPVLRALLEDGGRLLRDLDPLQSPSTCASFMDSLDVVWETGTKKRKTYVHRILKILARSAAEAEKSTTEAQDRVLRCLIERMGDRVPHAELKTLYRLALNLSESSEKKLLLSLFDKAKQIPNVIASIIHEVAAAQLEFPRAERALSFMPRRHLRRMVPEVTLHIAQNVTGDDMETWLRLLRQVNGDGDTSKKLQHAALRSLASTLNTHVGDSSEGVRSTHPDALKQFVKAVLLCQSLDSQEEYPAETLSHIQVVLADVLVQLQTNRKAYTAFVDLALPLTARYAGRTTLLPSMQTTQENGLPLSTRMDFASVIADELAELQLPTANLSKTQAQDRTWALHACKRLTQALSKVGYALPAMSEETRQFEGILAYARANHALPIDHRDATTDLPSMDRVVLIHQLAHHYSMDTTLTQRAAWRCIYTLYRYLKSHSLPVGSLFTKSLIEISITRPLTEHQFISARRLIWVCHVVRKVQGEAAAAQLEHIFHERRGETIDHAKRTYVDVGGDRYRKAHIGTMKRLRLI